MRIHKTDVYAFKTGFAGLGFPRRIDPALTLTHTPTGTFRKALILGHDRVQLAILTSPQAQIIMDCAKVTGREVSA